MIGSNKVQIATFARQIHTFACQTSTITRQMRAIVRQIYTFACQTRTIARQIRCSMNQTLTTTYQMNPNKIRT